MIERYGESIAGYIRTDSEGQLLRSVENVVNLQALNSDAPQIVIAKTFNDITNIINVTLAIPASSVGQGNGIAVIAEEVYP